MKALAILLASLILGYAADDTVALGAPVQGEYVPDAPLEWTAIGLLTPFGSDVVREDNSGNSGNNGGNW